MNHSKKTVCMGVLSAACATLLTLAMPASASQVLARADLHGTDFIDWKVTLGGDGNTLPNPQFIHTDGGVLTAVSVAGGLLTRQDEGISWSGDFAPGAHLLSAGLVSPVGPISISFDTGLSAIGAQLQTRGYSPPDYNGSITVYDDLDNLLETYVLSGHSTKLVDNTAIFLGVSRSTADIFRVDFNIGVPGFEFAINQVDLIAGLHMAPLPGSAGLTLLALGLLGSTLSRRRQPR